MKHLFLAIIAMASAAVVGTAAHAQTATEASDNLRVDHSVVYIGSDKDRVPDFEQFLKERFTEVTVLPPSALRDSDSSVDALETLNACDTIIVDANLATLLPPGYDRPMVLISGAGVQTAESLGAKADWL